MEGTNMSKLKLFLVCGLLSLLMLMPGVSKADSCTAFATDVASATVVAMNGTHYLEFKEDGIYSTYCDLSVGVGASIYVDSLDLYDNDCGELGPSLGIVVTKGSPTYFFFDVYSQPLSSGSHHVQYYIEKGDGATYECVLDGYVTVP
jgi:hypothetical protein